MTWFQMYLFTRLDGIHVALMIGCVILGLLILFAPPIIDIASFDGRNWAEEKAKKARLLKKAEMILISLFVIFGGLKIAIPTQKEMAAIIVVPAIVNNEQIQQIGKNGLDLTAMATDYLKSIMEEKTAKLKKECEK